MTAALSNLLTRSMTISGSPPSWDIRKGRNSMATIPARSNTRWPPAITNGSAPRISITLTGHSIKYIVQRYGRNLDRATSSDTDRRDTVVAEVSFR